MTAPLANHQAEIFRAALAQMQRNRRIDRSIDMVVSGDDGPDSDLRERGGDAVKA